MSRTTPVRKDDKGLYVIAGGYVARPGEVAGYAHAYDMSDGGLREGDRVKARHVSQTPLTEITPEDGKKLRWYHDGYSPEVQRVMGRVGHKI